MFASMERLLQMNLCSFVCNSKTTRSVCTTFCQ